MANPDDEEMYGHTTESEIEEQSDTSSQNTGKICIGRVGAPPQKEATSTHFQFWVPDNRLVERTQIVTCESTLAGVTYNFWGIVNEVYRQSRKRSMSAEFDEADGEVDHEPPFKNDGFTYADVSILRSPIYAPPQERSRVYLAAGEDARIAYGADEIDEHAALEVGLIKNGVNAVAGPGVIDLDYLLGTNGGHMNVNGSAGRGTKSSFLLFINWLLLRKSRKDAQTAPSDGERWRVVPIILNVKGQDLFYIDRRSNRFKPETHLADWEALGISDPQPFQNVEIYAPQMAESDISVPTGRGDEVKPYSWSLSDCIEGGLFSYLFAEIDANDANFGALVLDVEAWLTRETNEAGNVKRSLRNHEGVPQTFQALLTWVNDQSDTREAKWRNHHPSTWKKLYRRLLKLVLECKGVLRIEDHRGHPLRVTRSDIADPQVIDLSSLAGKPEIQRFVVATIFRQLVEARTGTNALPGLVYLVTLDELNRFAPRGANDPITRLIETVAAEMRSQGIILLGAQQQASRVSEKVIENSALRVLGRTGTLELDATVWRFLSSSAKSKASVLSPGEKLILQDNFREPMHVRVPFPVWAMNPREAMIDAPEENDENDYTIY
jgi:hypothetical protein